MIGRERIGLGHFNNRRPPIEGKINAEGYERAKNRPEQTALPHMKPVRLDLNNGDRAVALKIHIESVEDGVHPH